MFLHSQQGKFPKLLVFEGTNPRAPASDVGGDHSKLLDTMPLTLEALGGVPISHAFHNVDACGFAVNYCALPPEICVNSLARRAV